ncbi:hypothetical protein [Aeromonas caviae]|uniref:hypothetical protein n=1 Tax=Aeromonas caviae TaxID=648 RepID=UPI003F745F12
MTDITICPHLLVDYNMENPDDIEEQIIIPLREILDEAYLLGIKVYLSEHIINSMRDSFPWDKIENPAWKGYVLGWSTLINKYIEKKVFVINHDLPLTDQPLVCNCISQQINDIFINFLNVFAKDIFAQNHHAEGVISTDACGNNIAYKKIHPVKGKDDLPLVKHPWLRTYDRRLPYNGEHRFIPSADWKLSPTPIRGPGPKYGYRDINGYDWAWDRLHDTHWDVQIGAGRGNYMNISPDGRRI